LILSTRLSGQGTCPLTNPPPSLGDNGYTGQNGYTFDYWSQAGTANATHYFQLRVRNVGPNPLTFDWENADFFRRGVPSAQEAKSECRADGNPPNVVHGLIKYGPNTQFSGPDAKFYHYQQGSSVAANSRKFSVKWTAILENGNKYVIDFSVSATAAERNLTYIFTNVGNPIEITWPTILSMNALQALRTQNPVQYFRNNRMALPRDGTAKFQFTGNGPISLVTAPLSVFTEDNVLVYRDQFAGLQFVGLPAPAR